MLSTEELATLTLKSPFVYEYGDAPYFKGCLNEFPLHFFVRYRASKDDPSQHRWSRLLEVVDRHSPHADAASASTTTTTTPVAPLRWREKFFLIALRVEGEEKCVELPRLSSKPPTAEEVMEYCARRAESQLREGNRRETEVDANDVAGVTSESAAAHRKGNCGNAALSTDAHRQPLLDARGGGGDARADERSGTVVVPCTPPDYGSTVDRFAVDN
ncbi:hypothetical protein TRSC58_00997 [Trypanosoma rangeli SC58]|uniref:Uncharacterized protein n=1 Tax=Trypanosoma rangeli SC58 TaxID=429131 RepID=A0A061JD58_TRYRA|nr:hypothetical protein TRSC58_00997 [Trypanosoma rangeli SC58]